MRYKKLLAPHPVLYVILLVLFASPISGQQHALTVEQCRADAAAWAPVDALNINALKSPEEWSTATAGASAASLDEINLRTNELVQCQKLDIPQTVFHQFDTSRYHSAVIFYSLIISGRMASFLQRNHLTQQFLEEDKAGKR